MQQGYGGGVSEFPQFMVDASSLFSISSAAPQTAPSLGQQAQNLSGTVAPPSLQPHFSHFHSHIPFTQQLFQQHHHTPSHHVHHHFQLFNHTQHSQQDHHERTRLMVHQQLGLDPESGPENSGGGGGHSGGSGGGRTHATPSFLNAAMGFKLAVDTGTGEDDVMLSGGGGNTVEEESAIKEPSWRPLDIDFISSNNKRCKDKEPDTDPPSPPPPPAKYFKKGPEAGNGNNYKLFSELEAIYKPGSSAGFGDCSVAGGSSNAGGNRASGTGGDGVDCPGTGMGNQTGTGSGSGLTVDENPLINEPVGAGDMSMAPTGTETSAGEEATPMKKASKSGGEGRRKRRRQRRLSSLAAFFERLVRQLVDHQEALHNRFLESMERREQERSTREESWRLQEAAKAAREASARAQERALASAREAAIVSFLEKITGETINLPTNPPDLDITGIGGDATNNTNNMLSTHVVDMSENQDLGNASAGTGLGFNTSRWPKTEVQALIRVRSGLEARFQEPGLKGPLWEEVSMRMTGLGYRRSAKRCKEKWENINKYFRKAKESGKKRPQHSKTCPYFQQLDQLYSKSSSYMYSPSSPSVNPTGDAEVAKGGSELLDAVVVPLDQMGSSREFDREGIDGEDEDEEEEERHEEREEGEGESHGHGQEVADQRTNESSLFF